MHTKICFLDVDGPLATDKYFNSDKFTLSSGSVIPYKWDPDCCSAMAEILTVTRAKVVLSSDWRLHYSLDDMKELFDMYGLDPERLIGFTGQAKWRRYEIEQWIETHQIKQWVAVDDMDLGFKTNFVHIKDTEVGIANNYIKNQIINYLK